MRQADPGTTSIGSELPHIAGSASELLAASHIVQLTVMRQAATAWTLSDDGLEHRKLHLAVRVDRQLKGQLLQAVGSVLEVPLAQQREPGMRVSDYHGFWSHQNPNDCAGYLLLATARSNDIQVLLQDPAIQGWLPAELAADADAATELEHQHAPTQAADASAAQQLLRQVQDHRQTWHGLLGRYVLARLASQLRQNEPTVASALILIAQQYDTEPTLRDALVNGVYDNATQLGVDARRRQQLARSLFELLLLPASQAMVDRLVQVQLYNLLLRPGQTPPRPAAVVPDSAVRGRIDALLANLPGDRAHALRAWLREDDASK